MSGMLGVRLPGRVAAAVVSLGLAAGFTTLGAGAGAASAAEPPTAPPLVDSKSASDETTAQAIAKQFGHDVLVDSSVTSTNQVSALPDGSLQLTASSVPVRAKVGSSWEPIDLGLTSSGGFLVPAVSTQAVQFSLGGVGPLARVQDSSGTWIAEASPFGSLPKPTVKGPTATYRDVLPDVDLQLTATVTGMSEILVVKTAAAAANPKLTAVRFAVTGSSVSADSAGNARAGAQGGVRAGTPLWWDSSQGSSAAGPSGTLIPQPVSQSVSGDAVTLDAGAAATTDGVQYPVYVDPDWSAGQTHAWFIDAGFPNQAYLDSNPYSTVEKSGWIPASASGSGGVAHTARAFWNFNTSALVGSVVSAAHLNVVLNGAFNCSIMRQANVWTTSGAPIGGTWNSTGNVYGSIVGSATPGGCGAAVGFSVLGAGQQAGSGVSSTTLAIRANSESDQYNWQKWNIGATLTATYDHTPNAPTSLAFTSPSRTCSTSQTQPTFIDGTQPITISDHTSDPDAGQNLTTSFTIHGVTNSAFSTTISTASQAQGTASVTVAANALGNGEYSWNSNSSDGTLTSAVSATCYFQVETTPPGLPSVTPTSSGTPTVGGAMTFTLGSVAADNVQLFAIWWVDGLQSNPSSTPATTQVTAGSALPACGSSDGGVRYVCPDAGSHNATAVVVAPIDHLSTLMVASFDQSARISLSGTQVATAYQVTAAGDTTNVGLLKGHLWDPAASNPTDTSVPDLSESTDTSGNSAPQPLDDATLTTSTFLGQPDTVVFAGDDDTNPYPTNAHTESGELDASGSFTVSVWVNFSTSSGGGIVFDQMDYWGSAAGYMDSIFLNFIGPDNNEVNFCAYNAASPPSTGDICARGGEVASDTWTLVTAVRDKVNHQLRVYLNGSPTPVAEATVQDFAPVSSSLIGFGGGVDVNEDGSFKQSYDGAFYGYLNRPSVFPGVISSSQLANLYAGLNPNNE